LLVMQHSDDEKQRREPAQRTMLFARLARAVAATDAGPLPLRLCQCFVKIVQAQGGAITLIGTGAQRTTLAVTDAVADRIEDLQDVLGEGPSQDAFRLREPVSGVLGDVSDGGPHKWPMLADAANVLGTELMVSAYPMRAVQQVVGTITVYRSDTERLAVSDADGGFLADAVAAAIVRDASEHHDGGSWTTRDRINQATGMVVAQLGVAPDDALALIRAFAFSHSLTMDRVADEIIARRQDFSRNADFRGQEAP
jgi:hypothetical protein